MAIKRSMEELNHTVQAIIKEKDTAIHPSVEWRFRKAALNFIRQQHAGVLSEIEPIVFENVHALYGASDIRGSSTQRQAVIQADLLEQLHLARDIFVVAYRQQPLPFLDEFAYRIGMKIAALEVGLSSGMKRPSWTSYGGRSNPCSTTCRHSALVCASTSRPTGRPSIRALGSSIGGGRILKRASP